MSAEQYLRGILSRESVNNSIPFLLDSRIRPLMQHWANRFLADFIPSGSFAKGTANKSGTDIDFLISISPNCNNSLSDIYNSLYSCLAGAGLRPKKQNVSLNINIDGYSVDLVPAKQQDYGSSDHSLWRHKANTWTKTNIAKHVQYVRSANMSDKIRLIKLWRDQKGLDFPSFYLEMAVIKALSLSSILFSLDYQILEIFRHMQENITSIKFVDPANTNNIISDDLTLSEKGKIQNAAKQALCASDWSQIVI